MNKRWWMGGMIAALMLLLIGANNTTGAAAQAVTSPTPAPTVTPYITTVNAIVATLTSTGNPDPTAIVRAALTTLKPYKVTIKQANQAFKSSADALAYANAAKNGGPAQLVIWAEASGVLHYELPQRVALEANDPRTREQVTENGLLALPDEMELPLADKPDNATLTAYTQAQLYLAVADYARATDALFATQTDINANKALTDSALNAEVQFETAFVDARQNHIDNAGTAFTDLTKGQARDALQALAWSNLGGLFIIVGNVTSAGDALDSALKIDPALSWALINRGTLNLLQGNDQAALDDYTTVIQAQPTNEFALNARGWLQVLNAKTTEALKDLALAVKIDPRFVDAYLNLASLYDRQGQLDAALSFATKAVSLDPQYGQAYSIRAGYLYGLGQASAALTDFNAAITLGTSDYITLYGRGATYEQLGNIDQALADYTRSIDERSDYPYSYANRGHLYLNRGDFNAAVLDETLAIQFDTRHNVLRTYFFRAQAYQGLHRWDEAIRDYKKYISVSPQGRYVTAAKAYIAAIGAL